MRFTSTLCCVLLCNLYSSPLFGVKTPPIPRLKLPQESAQKTNNANRPNTTERSTFASSSEKQNLDTRPHTMPRIAPEISAKHKIIAKYLDKQHPGTQQSFRSSMPLHPQKTKNPKLKAILDAF